MRLLRMAESILFRTISADLTDQRRDDLEQVAHDAIVGNLKNWCIRILVDSDDRIRAGHARKVLDCTGNTASDIDLGRDRFARLSDLMCVRDPSGIYRRAGRADLTAKLRGKIADVTEMDEKTDKRDYKKG